MTSSNLYEITNYLDITLAQSQELYLIFNVDSNDVSQSIFFAKKSLLVSRLFSSWMESLLQINLPLKYSTVYLFATVFSSSFAES